MTLTSDDLESHRRECLVYLTNITKWFVAALCLIMDVWTYGQMDIWTDRPTDGQMYVQTDGYFYRVY